MNETIILQNQVLIMEALVCMGELPNAIRSMIREQIIFTNARIKALV